MVLPFCAAIPLNLALQLFEQAERTSAGRPRWCTAQHEALGLREGDVAAVRERCDAQAAAVADVLVVVLDLRITDVHLRA